MLLSLILLDFRTCNKLSYRTKIDESQWILHVFDKRPIQAEQEINKSRVIVIYSFNNANLLYDLAAKESLRIRNKNYSEKAMAGRAK
jgi:hypothetical protein